MKKLIFLLTMMLSIGIASVGATQTTDISYNVDVGKSQVITVDVQASVNNVVFEPVQMDFATYSFENDIAGVFECDLGFYDVGLKPSETLIPTISITASNYLTGNYNYTKHRYRYSYLQCNFGLRT